MQLATFNLWKSLNQDINHIKEKKDRPTKYPQNKFWTYEVTTRKKFRPTNTHKKKLDPWNADEKKIWTHEYPPENIGPTNYPREKISYPTIPTRKILDPQNTHEKKFQTNKRSTRKNFRHTKYPRRHNGTMAINSRDPW